MNYILITGGAGFIPGSLAEKLSEDQNNFIVLVDNFVTSSPAKVPKASNIKFIKCDVNNYSDIAPIMSSYRFNNVFHYAALVGVKRTLENPISVLKDINGIKNILDLSKNTGVNRVFFSSSSEVYGEPVEFPQNEHTTPLNSKLPYAIVKNVGEAFLKSYEKEYDLKYTIFRFFNTYGPRQSNDFVVAKFINAAMNNEDITLYGNGLQTRTFCYIDDNIEATINALIEDKHINDTVNIGNNIETSVADLAKIIIELTSSKSKIIFLPPLKEGDMTRRKPDISKMKILLKRDILSLEEGLKKVISAIKSNLDYSDPK
jgi:nucleoside-diphosphate-sugar epimerase